MDYHETIRQLWKEAKRIERAIKILESRKAGRSVRGRKTMPLKERAQVAERMKNYWANWREERAREMQQNDFPDSQTAGLEQLRREYDAAMSDFGTAAAEYRKALMNADDMPSSDGLCLLEQAFKRQQRAFSNLNTARQRLARAVNLQTPDESAEEHP